VWVQQYSQVEGQLSFRANDNIPPAAVLIVSPYDPEAHVSVKRSTVWTGFKVHVSETCDEASPHLITHVETTPATTQDMQMTPQIHQALADKHLLPGEHLLDTGYVDGEHLVSRKTGLWRSDHRTGRPRWKPGRHEPGRAMTRPVFS
jgi:transposase